MCGICGIYRFNKNPVDPDALRVMTQHMIHRGPDDEGFYCSGGVGIGFRRLSIIDVAGGHQPISNEDGSAWVVMNGEIYNHIELRHELQLKGHTFRTSSDVEVLVHLYEEYGTDAIHHLNGMFGFALYDVAKQALWIARDRLGIKPLFYAETLQGLFFASDLRALIQALPSSEVNRTSFLRYLASGYVPEPDTIYEHVKKFPPAHWMWVTSDGKNVVKEYWAVTHFQDWRGTSHEAALQLNALLEDSVRLQLRSDVPLAVSLSGGLDSTTILALAAKQLSTPITTFTANFINKPAADVQFARDAAKRFKTRHFEIPISAADGMKALEDLIPFLDEPIADSALLPSYAIAEAARSQGIKVLLTGAGGDEIFGGYQRHHQPRLGRPAWIAEHLPSTLRRAVSALIKLVDPDKAIEAADSRVALGVGVSGISLNACAALLKHPGDFDQIVACLHELYDDISLNGSGPGYEYTRMMIDLRCYLVGNVLALTDKATMGCSVEARVPLLDHRLVEFAFSLPTNLNLLEGQAKGLMRATLKGLLPDALLQRPKEGFNAPMNLWVLDELSNEINDELLHDPIPVFEELLNPAELRALLTQKRTARAAETIFSLFMFSRWYRRHCK